MTLKRIKELRAELKAEQISYMELAEIDAAADMAGVEVTEEMMADDLLDILDQTHRQD